MSHKYRTTKLHLQVSLQVKVDLQVWLFACIERDLAESKYRILYSEYMNI